MHLNFEIGASGNSHRASDEFPEAPVAALAS